MDNNCKNCGSVLKNGVFNSVSLLPQNQIDLINEYSDSKASEYCGKCGFPLYNKYKPHALDEISSLKLNVAPLLNEIPIITINSPLNWDYDVIGMVTSQSTMGTGIAVDFSTTINDLLGTQSNSVNSKINSGEILCLAQLRIKALSMGGNAIIGTNIDYSEFGGNKSMLMICMAGTAINLKNFNILGEQKSAAIKNIIPIAKRLRRLNYLIS